jgi:8-oxo-dGTP pyrophosphatase MutT (NUDIX family)
VSPPPLPPTAAALSAALAERQRTLLPHRPRRAAVLVTLVEGGGRAGGEGPRLLLTRRAAHLASHGGEVAFPGGMWEEGDGDLTRTALREAEEEVGLRASAVSVLGLLDDMLPKSERVAVTPVVAHALALPPLRPNPDEVARVFEVPLDALMEAARWEVKRVSWRGVEWPIYSFEYDSERLWGLSAYITLLTLSLLPSGAPVEVDWGRVWRQQADHDARAAR